MCSILACVLAAPKEAQSKSKRCKSVAANLTNFGRIHWLAVFFGGTIISVIFAGAIARWPSHLIEWSPERLTSHSFQSNSYSYCSKLHSEKHTATMLVSQPIKIKAMQVCSSLFDKLWQDGVPSTRIFSPAVTNWISRVFGETINLCHICRGYWNVTQSFDRMYSWRIDISFSAVKQFVQQAPPFQNWHCKQPPQKKMQRSFKR